MMSRLGWMDAWLCLKAGTGPGGLRLGADVSRPMVIQLWGLKGGEGDGGRHSSWLKGRKSHFLAVPGLAPSQPAGHSQMSCP